MKRSSLLPIIIGAASCLLAGASPSAVQGPNTRCRPGIRNCRRAPGLCRCCSRTFALLP